MDLNDYRKQIDEIDEQLVQLFRQRMEAAAAIAAYKKANGLPVLDAGRERAKLEDVCSKVPAALRGHTAALYAAIFAESRAYQQRLMEETP